MNFDFKAKPQIIPFESSLFLIESLQMELFFETEVKDAVFEDVKFQYVYWNDVEKYFEEGRL